MRVQGHDHRPKSYTLPLKGYPAYITDEPLQLRQSSGNKDIPEARSASLQENGDRSLKSEETVLCEQNTFTISICAEDLTTMSAIVAL